MKRLMDTLEKMADRSRLPKFNGDGSVNGEYETAFAELMELNSLVVFEGEALLDRLKDLNSPEWDYNGRIYTFCYERYMDYREFKTYTPQFMMDKFNTATKWEKGTDNIRVDINPDSIKNEWGYKYQSMGANEEMGPFGLRKHTPTAVVFLIGNWYYRVDFKEDALEFRKYRNNTGISNGFSTEYPVTPYWIYHQLEKIKDALTVILGNTPKRITDIIDTLDLHPTLKEA